MDPRQRRGANAEDAACSVLADAGMVVIERNVRYRCGELDIVAYDGDCLVFVEVRSRRSAEFGSALHQVGYRKQRQVARVAEHYLKAKRLRPRRCRFDVVGVTGCSVTHIKDAFRPGG